MTTTTSLSSRALAELKNLLEAHGLHAGLTFLNQRVPYRFSAIYRLSDLQLRRVSFVDKQGGGGEDFAALP